MFLCFCNVWGTVACTKVFVFGSFCWEKLGTCVSDVVFIVWLVVGIVGEPLQEPMATNLMDVCMECFENEEWTQWNGSWWIQWEDGWWYEWGSWGSSSTYVPITITDIAIVESADIQWSDNGWINYGGMWVDTKRASED